MNVMKTRVQSRIVFLLSLKNKGSQALVLPKYYEEGGSAEKQLDRGLKHPKVTNSQWTAYF